MIHIHPWLVAVRLAAKSIFGRPRLNAPTQFAFINGAYFIVDCWHNRILVSQTFETDLSKWRCLTGFHHPHRIIFYKGRYYVADTDHHRIVHLSEKLTNAKVLDTKLSFSRPHDILVHEDHLFVADSVPGGARVVALTLDSGVSVARSVTIEQAYCRSMCIIDETLFVCDSGGGRILRLDPATLKLVGAHPTKIDGQIIGSLNRVQQMSCPNRIIPNGLARFNGRYYLSNYFYAGTANRFISFLSFDDLNQTRYVDHSDLVSGVPYYIDVNEQRMLMGEIDNYSRCVELTVNDGQLSVSRAIA
jgi:hypothetical protein